MVRLVLGKSPKRNQQSDTLYMCSCNLFFDCWIVDGYSNSDVWLNNASCRKFGFCTFDFCPLVLLQNFGFDVYQNDGFFVSLLVMQLFHFKVYFALAIFGSSICNSLDWSILWT